MTAHRIDVHHHLIPPGYVGAIGEERIGRLIVAGKTPQWSPDQSLEAMERNGIGKAVMSISAPGFACGDAAQAQVLARACNDYGARIIADHGKRFGVLAGLPMPDVDACLKEISYALDELKLDGVVMMTHVDGRYPGDPAFAPIFDELNRRGAVVFFHPDEPVGGGENLGIPAATLEFPFDTTRAVVSLLFSGTFTRCRNIKFIFNHAGGTVPFLAERISRLEMRADLRSKVPDGVMFELKRLYFDTALSANPYSFSALTMLLPPEQILFGSDYPFAPERTMAASVEGMGKLGLAPEVLEKIERTNALTLFPRLAGD